MRTIYADESSGRRVVKTVLEKLKFGPVLVHCLQFAPTFFVNRKQDRNGSHLIPFRFIPFPPKQSTWALFAPALCSKITVIGNIQPLLYPSLLSVTLCLTECYSPQCSLFPWILIETMVLFYYKMQLAGSMIVQRCLEKKV